MLQMTKERTQNREEIVPDCEATRNAGIILDCLFPNIAAERRIVQKQGGGSGTFLSEKRKVC